MAFKVTLRKRNREIIFIFIVCIFTGILYQSYSEAQSKHGPMRNNWSYLLNETATNGLVRRLNLYNEQIERIRQELVWERSMSKGLILACDSSNVFVADAASSDYFKTLQNFTEIRTIFCEDSLENIYGYLRPKYYPYVSNDCTFLESKSIGGLNSSRLRYGAECRESFDETWPGYGLQEVALAVGLPSNSMVTGNATRILTFIHIIPDAISFDNGDVLHGNLKIVPQKCRRILTKSCPHIPNSAPKYKEVFTITEFWGYGFFHGTLEDLPRIAPYMSFLRRNPQVKIHVASKLKLLQLLGIDNSRLITAPTIRADVLYMPAGGPCGNSPLFTTQLLANLISQSTTRKIPSNRRNGVVLIKRSHKRWFANHNAILTMLQKHASRLNLTVEVFGDNPLPSIRQTMDMFSKAVVVVAPHGAGEANLILSQPGTLLIEGLCYDGDNRANLCYRNMAQALALRYYGLIYQHQCMKITPEQIERPLVQFFGKQFNYDARTL